MFPPRPFEVTSSRNAASAIDAFEEALRRWGIEIRPGSELEHACLVITQFHDAHVSAKMGQRPGPWSGFRDDLQLGIGMLKLAQLVTARASNPEFAALVPHLRLLNEGAPTQTQPSRTTDQASDKIFELRLALACLATGRDLDLDDPLKSSGGSNPDVMCRMRDGRLWGFACKVIHGDAPMTLFERLAEGVEQIERSAAEVGLVVVSLKNRLRHDKLLPILEEGHDDDVVLGAHHAYEQARRMLSGAFQGRVDDMVRHVGHEPIADALRGRKALPGLCCPLESVITVVPPESGSGTPIPTVLSYLHTVRTDWGVAKRLDDDAEAILKDINSGLVTNRPVSLSRHTRATAGHVAQVLRRWRRFRTR